MMRVDNLIFPLLFSRYEYMIGFHFIFTLGGRVSAGNTRHTWSADFLQRGIEVSICLIPFIGYIRWGEKREDAECLQRELVVCVCVWLVFCGADLRLLSLRCAILGARKRAHRHRGSSLLALLFAALLKACCASKINALFLDTVSAAISQAVTLMEICCFASPKSRVWELALGKLYKMFSTECLADCQEEML